MLKQIGPFISTAWSTLREILSSLKRQSLNRGYLLAIAIFVIAVLFAFLALSPILYSFVYPLF